MRSELPTNPTTFHFASSLEEAGWFLAKSKNQVPVEIYLGVKENEVVFSCDFEGEAVSEEHSFESFVDEKIDHPEVFYKTVAEGLKLLGAELNRLLKANRLISALNTPPAPAGTKKFLALKTKQEAAYV